MVIYLEERSAYSLIDRTCRMVCDQACAPYTFVCVVGLFYLCVDGFVIVDDDGVMAVL